MEETPEEILARLQRYVDSVRARGEFDRAGPPPASSVAVVAEPQRVDAGVLTDQRPHFGWSFSTLSRTIAGQIICVATCVVTILLWVNVTHMVGYILTFIAAGLLGVGVARRIHFTGWALIGLAVGLLLGRFS